jgi:hypothetical protein
MNTTKNIFYKPFLLFAVCASIYSSHTYVADNLNVPRRQRMPSPKPQKYWSELNNRIFVTAEDQETPVVVNYLKKLGPNCSGNYYASLRTAVFASCNGFKECMVEKKTDNSSTIKFICADSRKEYILTAQDCDGFTIKSKEVNQISIIKDGFGEVALFTLQQTTQRQPNNDHPRFEIIKDDDGIAKIVSKKGP